jgi:hypothetical protein
MQHQRFAAFTLGAWIMGSLFMIFVATQNFQMADALSNAGTHAALRDMAGKLNQRFFVDWERLELFLAVAFAALAWIGVQNGVLGVISLAPLTIVGVQSFVVTPRMLSLSANLGDAAVASQFARLHAIYGISEVIKLVLLFAIAAILLPGWRRRDSTATAKIPLVDYADHGHIDR